MWPVARNTFHESVRGLRRVAAAMVVHIVRHRVMKASPMPALAPTWPAAVKTSFAHFKSGPAAPVEPWEVRQPVVPSGEALCIWLSKT